ncbi:MAG: glycine oxidase ThiO [Gemmatimonadales bacterium]
MPSPDVIVVGGGVIGAACARSLAHDGLAVTVIEAGPKSGTASIAAAGMLAPLAETVAEDPLLGLGVRARDLYNELAPQLLEETGIDIGLWTGGILQVTFRKADAAAARSEIAWQRQSGFRAEWLSAEELQKHAPGVSQDAIGAALAPEDGGLEPLALLDALMKSAELKGTTLVRGESVQEVLRSDARVTGVRTSNQTYRSGDVVVAAGAWSGRITGLPRPLSVEPVRGQMAAVDWPTDEPPAIVYGAGGYVMHRQHEAIVGSTMEYAGFDASVTTAGLQHLSRTMGRLYPVLTGVEFKRTWAGFRPGTPDGRPIVGPDPDVTGLWYATGHGRNGILLAGLTGELLAQLHSGTPTDLDLSAIDPARFWSS